MDVGGGSDPYCVFFTNPPGLFTDDRHAPITTVKLVKGGGEATGGARPSAGPGAPKAPKPRPPKSAAPPVASSSTSADDVEMDKSNHPGTPPPSPPEAPTSSKANATPKSGETVDRVVIRAARRSIAAVGGALFAPGAGSVSKEPAPPTIWEHAEIPLLRPRNIAPVKLPFVTLIIALYDKDQIGAHDLIGSALVQLCPDGHTPGATPPEEYTVSFDEELVYGNVSSDIGHIKGKITVSFGKKLAAAEELAKSDEAGTQAGALSDPWLETCNVGMCSVM